MAGYNKLPEGFLETGKQGDALAPTGRPDRIAFDSMQKATHKASDRLFENDNMFTESEYNINATHKERMDYDLKAYNLLHELYKEDRGRIEDIKDWDFDRYLKNIKGSYLEEKFMNPKKEDPDYYSEAGDMLSSIYSNDPAQLVLSAKNFQGDTVPSRDRSRANVSIKAPGAERY